MAGIQGKAIPIVLHLLHWDVLLAERLDRISEKADETEANGDILPAIDLLPYLLSMKLPVRVDLLG